MRRSIHQVALTSILALVQPWCAAQGDPPSQYQQALKASDAGDLGLAWTLIQKAHAELPEDEDILNDFLTIGAWAGHAGVVFPLAKSFKIEEFPDYVLEALGSAALDGQDLAFAKVCYGEELRRNSLSREGRLGLIRVALATDDYPAASALLDALPPEALKESAVSQIRATLAEAKGDWGELLSASEDILAQDSASEAGLRWRFQALRRLGLPDRALELTPPALLDLDEKAAIQREVLDGQKSHLAELPGSPARERGTRELLERYRSLLASLPAGVDPDIRTGVIEDYLGLLGWGYHAPEVIREYHRLVAPRAKGLPGIHQVVGDAWLQLGRPTKALTEFDAVLVDLPGDPDAEMGRFWALLDQGRWRQARQVAHAAVSRLPPKDASAVLTRDELEALRRDAQGLGYTEALAEAEHRLEELRRRAPADGSSLEALALVWRFRSKPRQARDLLNQSAQRAPERGWTWISLAAAQRECGEFADETQSLTKASELMGGSAGLDSAQRESSRARAAGFSIEGQNAHATTLAPDAPTGPNEQALQVHAESPLISDHWRIEGDGQTDHTRLMGNGIQRNRGAVGVTFLGLLGQAEVAGGTQNSGPSGDPGRSTFLVKGALTPSDALRLDLALAHNSEDTPLRAWNAGIRGDEGSLGASYTWNESSALKAGVSRMNLTDTNRRESAWMTGDQRLYAWGPHIFTAEAGIWLSRNSLSPALAPYYNPVRDAALNLQFTYVGPLWQEGPWQIRHKAQISTGTYDESVGYGSRGTFSIAYGFLMNLGRGMDAHIGLGYLERPYDGIVNRGTELQFGISGRLP